jgi:hypothetical protein
MGYRKISFLAFLIITSNLFLPVPHSAVGQGLLLRVSAASSDFRNHFFGPQIVQIIIDDPGATDAADSTVGLQVKGVTAPRVHLGDGLWYHFFAEQISFLILLDVLTDGARDNAIAVANPPAALAPIDLGNPLSFDVSGSTFTQTPSNTDSFVSEITVIGGSIFVELDQNDIFPTLPTPFCDATVLGAGTACPVTSINPDLNIPNDSVENSAANTNIHTRAGSIFAPLGGASLGNIDWPYIMLTGINESDQISIRAGSESINLTYTNFNDSILSAIDRKTDYPLNAEIIVSFTDFMYNINPIEEDVLIFVHDTATGIPQGVIYNPVRNFNPDGAGLVTGASGRNLPNILPVLFRPILNFDTRQILEIDAEGMRSLKFHEFVDVGADSILGSVDDTTGTFGPSRTAENSRLVMDTAFTATPTRRPVVEMIESDPNASYFESIDEQQGSRAGIFAGVNDRVANFDYFDIVNSAAMTTHDAMATVDRELYDSGDRATLKVDDPDQNLRSRVTEQPSAARSSSFVKVGAPFPMGNNPTFSKFFGKNTLPVFNGAQNALFNGYGANGILGPAGPGNDDLTRYGIDGILGTPDDLLALQARTGIEEVRAFLAVDPDDTNNNSILDTTEALMPLQRQTNIQNALNTGTVGGAVVSISPANGGPAAAGTFVFPAGTPLGSVHIDVFPVSTGGAISATVSHVVQLDINNDSIIQTDSLFAGFTNEVILVAGNGQIRDAAPERSQKIALEFSTNGITAPLPGSPSRSSAIVVNSAVTLADLNKFTEFRATGFQIRANGLSGTSKPAGQAFAVDPTVAETALFISALSGTPAPTQVFTHVSADTPGANALSAAMDQQVFRVLYPEYNMVMIDLSEISTITETPSGLNFDSIAVQITVDGRGVTDSSGVPVALPNPVTRLVDFNPFEANDADPVAGTITAQMMDNTKIGTGVFRIVDFLSQDWDGDGIAWPSDAGPAGSTNAGDQIFFDDLKLQSTVVFVRTMGLTQSLMVVEGSSINPVTGSLIASTSHVAALDIDGLDVVIPPPTLLSDATGSTIVNPPGTEATFPAQRTVDEVTLVTSEHAVYRIQTKEQGVNSSIFAGRLDFMTANQFDTVQRALADLVFSGDPARAFLPGRFIPPNRLAFSYSDINIVQVFREVSATFIYETTDGKIYFDSGWYLPQKRAKLTLEDQDLNRRPDAIERYDLPVAGFIFIEFAKVRVDDTCARTNPVCFLGHVDSSLKETGPDTGVFQAQVDMPPRLLLANGTIVNTNRDDLEVSYEDVRDSSSVRQEFDYTTAVRTEHGTLTLDRNAYPQGPRIAPNDPLLGAIMYINIKKGFFTQDPELRDVFDLTRTVDFSNETGIPNDIRDAFEIRIFNGRGNEPVIYSANPAKSIKNGGERFPFLDRNMNEITFMLESAPATNLYEMEFMLYCPDAVPEISALLTAPVCTDTLFGQSAFKANSPIEVIFNDPQDDSGTPEEITASAVIQGVTAQLGTDKINYDIGDPLTFFMVEPDFNFDSKAVEQVDFFLVGITTDRTPVEEVPITILLNVLCALKSSCTTEPGFRESDYNSGIFGAIAPPGLLDTIVASRGSKIELVYHDLTPSGGGFPPRIEHDIFLNANMPEITFDKEEYTPFDEVNITILSPDSNEDPFQIETIAPLVSTSSGRGFLLRMGETGPDSRIFKENLKLTPGIAIFPGDIIAQREDGLTVEFRLDEDTVLSKSVFINYHVGLVMFDKNLIAPNERAVMRIIEPDENKSPDTIDTLDARIWSTTDRGGLLVTLRETGDRTGIFEEFITFTIEEESTGTRLHVSDGDTITAKYTDRTLPAPAALDSDGIFTVEVEELFASALIGKTGPPIERTPASQPVLVDQNGVTVEEVKADSQVLIQSEIRNLQKIKQKFAYIVNVKQNGITISFSWVSGELPAMDSVIAAQSWIPERPGAYDVEVFVWASVDDPVALSPVRTLNVRVS